MSFINVTAPAGAFPGKTYALHTASKLLVIRSSPNMLADILACRGMLVITQSGWQWWTGMAFNDFYDYVRQVYGAEPTLAQLLEHARRREFYQGYTQGLTVANGVSSSAYLCLTPYGTDALATSPVGVSLHAIPHASVAGRGSSGFCAVRSVFTSASNTPSLSNGAAHNVKEPHYSNPTGFEGPRGMNVGPIAPHGTDYGTPLGHSWMLSAIKSGLTYEQLIAKASEAVTTDGDARALSVSRVRALLTALGVSLQSRVLLPAYLLDSGRVATDFADRSVRLTSFSQAANPAGHMGDLAFALSASRVKMGARYNSFPIADGSNVYGSTSGPYKGLWGPRRQIRNVADASAPLGGKMLGLDTNGIFANQFFGLFHEIDTETGVYTRRTLGPDTHSTDAEWANWIGFGYDDDAPSSFGTVDTAVGQTEEGVGTQVLSAVNAGASRDRMVGQTAADTWMITPRTLTRLLIDPLTVSGTDAAWDATVAERVLALPDIGLANPTEQLKVPH